MTERHDSLKGISAANRASLAVLNRVFRSPFDAIHAADALSLELGQTRRLLAALASGGWLLRVRHGWYVTMPLSAADPSDVHEDPWLVAKSLFESCYIGGQTACQHWGFTTISSDVMYVVSTRKVTPIEQVVHGNRFKIRTIQDKEWFGTHQAMRRELLVDVSDPHRTIIDLVDRPTFAGGARLAMEALHGYFGSGVVDEGMLLMYGDRLGRGALFKRLGFLAEHGRLGSLAFAEACGRRVSKGITRLDPGQPDDGRIVSRWQLKVNVCVDSSRT